MWKGIMIPKKKQNMQGMLFKALKDDEKKECIIWDRNLKGKRIEKNVIKKLENKKKQIKAK